MGIEEENQKLYNEQISDELDSSEFDEDYNATSTDLNYDKWIREPSSAKFFEYLNKDIAGANLDMWEKAHIDTLYIYLKHLKALDSNKIDTKEAQLRTIEKIMQKVVTSTGKEGFMQKIRVSKFISRTGEYYDKKEKSGFVPYRRRGNN